MKLQEAVAWGIVDGQDEDALSIWAYSQSQSLPIVRMTDNNSSSCDKRALLSDIYYCRHANSSSNHNLSCSFLFPLIVLILSAFYYCFIIQQAHSTSSCCFMPFLSSSFMCIMSRRSRQQQQKQQEPKMDAILIVIIRQQNNTHTHAGAPPY